MSTYEPEFQEIAHCGGQLVVTVTTDASGDRDVQFGFRHSRPTPAALFAIYALPQGIPVATIDLDGMGDTWGPPPYGGCYPVLVASDSQGEFGHQCPKCTGYWRSGFTPSKWRLTCPYCGFRNDTHCFLSPAQSRYVRHLCEHVDAALGSDSDGESTVDLDHVIGEVTEGAQRPVFYDAELAQQNRYHCKACNDLNDILGRYGYCAGCGTHNGFAELEADLSRIRQQSGPDGDFSGWVRDSVSAFDSYARQIANQLCARVAMTPTRRSEWERKPFSDLRASAEALKAAFDIDLLRTLTDADREFAMRAFCRRHVHEHNGGEVDEKYIADGGDTSVKPKQRIREAPEAAERTLSTIIRIGRNLHEGFHAIFPPEPMPVEVWTRSVER